jgi:plasmid stabilization system protein ParE
MSWRLVLRSRAVREVKEAHDWYEAQREGLGDGFLAEFEHVLAVLEEHPLRFPVLHATVRRALTRRFPYAILFRIRDGQVVVLSVMHHARDPRRWPK